MDLNWPPIFADLIAIVQFEWLHLPWVHPECIVTPTPFIQWMLAYFEGTAILIVLFVLFYASLSPYRFNPISGQRWNICGLRVLVDCINKLLRSKDAWLMGEADSARNVAATDESWARAALFCVFTLFFGAILRNSFVLGIKIGLTRSSNSGFHTIGILIALTLIATTIGLLRYFRHQYDSKTLRILTIRFREDLEDDKDRARRFYMRPSLWQFVVWCRQMALFIISASLQLCQWCAHTVVPCPPFFCLQA